MPRGIRNPGIVITKDTLTPGLRKFGPSVKGKVTTYLQGQAPRVQDAARRGAPWNDRTGNARNGLFATYSGDYNGDRHEIRLYHTVPYGIWLEVRWAGKYAIIVPTITSEGQRIMAGLAGLIDKLGFSSGLVAGVGGGGSGLFA